jgi:hypothetical protein
MNRTAARRNRSATGEKPVGNSSVQGRTGGEQFIYRGGTGPEQVSFRTGTGWNTYVKVELL